MFLAATLLTATCGAPMQIMTSQALDAAHADRGAIAGRVVELETGFPLPDIAVDAVDPYGQTEGVGTDENGDYRLQLDPGAYRVTMHYPGADLEREPVVVTAHETTRLDVTFDTSLRGPHSPAPECPDTGSDRAATAADLDSLVHAVLARFSAHPEAMPDWYVLPRRGPLWVLAHTTVDGARQSIHPAAVTGLPRAFVAKSRPQIQFDAEQHRDGTAYLEIVSVDLDHACATIDIAIDIALPTNRDPYSLLCCCSVHDLYVKRDTWTFVGRSFAGCA